MFLFVRVLFPGAQGKNREPGLQKNSVRNFIGRRALLGEPFEKPRESVAFLCPAGGRLTAQWVSLS